MMSDLVPTLLLLLYGVGTWRLLMRAKLRNPRPAPALERVVSAAASYVKKQGRAKMTCEDVVYAALFDRVVAEALAARGFVVARVRSALAVHLASLPREPGAQGVAPEVKVALYRAKGAAVKAGRLEISTMDVLDAIPLETKTVIARAFDEARATSNDTGQPLDDNAEGPPPSNVGYRALAPPPLALVVFWNDDRTTMEFVQTVLAEYFAKADVEATLIMLAVHQEGATAIGPYSPEEARERVQRAAAFIASHGMPLRITVEPISFRPPPRGLWERLRARPRA